MVRSIAFIHTVALLVERFRPRFLAELPQQRCFHMLDESVLQDLLRDGPSPGITRRIVTLATLAADAGADLIVFTCSSTSPAIDAARKMVPVPIVKIDDAMYAEAARSDGRVGLLCTTRSTLEPSRSLLAEHVAASGTRVEAEPVLVDGAFDALSAGRREEHDALVTESALALAQRADRLVLAQASLAHLAEPLAQRSGKPVFASPEWMVRDVVARVAAAARAGHAQHAPRAEETTSHEKTVLGCIADDFTGATDLANNLVRAGMRVVQTIGVPDAVLSEEADAIVVALKSRTIAPPFTRLRLPPAIQRVRCCTRTAPTQ